GGGYFWWSSNSDTPAPIVQAPVSDGESGGPDSAATTPAQPETTAPPAEQAALSGADAGSGAGAAGLDKFTQRLLPDGSEVDDGRAGGEPAIGEGSSVAAAVQPPATPDGTAAAAGTGITGPSVPADADA